MMKKKIEKLFMFLTALMLLLVLSACGYTSEERIMMMEYKKTAKKNAIAYIEEKYGFTPSVLNAECSTIKAEFGIDFSPSPTGSVYVEMRDKKEDIDFWVLATGEEISSVRCWDNYQHKEIEAAVEEELENALGVDTAHIDLAYGQFDSVGKRVNGTGKLKKKYGLVHDYFDGTNLTEVLENASMNKMVTCFVDENYIPDLLECSVGELTDKGTYEGSLSDSDKLVKIFGKNIECLLINYNSYPSCNSVHKQGDAASVTGGYPFNFDMNDMHFYIKDHYFISSKSGGENPYGEYTRYELKKFDEFYYIQMGGTYCNFTKVENEMHDASNWNGRGFINAKKVYGEYAIDTDAHCLHLMIPTSTIEAGSVTEYMADRSIIQIAEQKYYVNEDNNLEIRYDIGHLSVIGDSSEADGQEYLTATLYFPDYYKDTIFSVFIDEEEN